MSRRRIDPRIAESPDLKRLADEGYALEIWDAHLVVHGIPYVTPERRVRMGKLVSTINFAGDIAIAPETHVANWVGEYPCHHDGRRIEEIFNASNVSQHGPTLVSQHAFSAKPVGSAGARYANFYEKVTEYVNRITGPASALDPGATARTFDVIDARDEDSVFRYTDSASARAGIGSQAARLAVPKIAIVGVGGTGSYVLDLVAKTPVKEIHLFDPDEFVQSSAFRAPGAASLEELRAHPKKVDYLKRRYDPMRGGIIAHSYAITSENVGELLDMHSVFVSVDHGSSRRLIVNTLVAHQVPCFDTGMGIYVGGEKLGGQLTVTALTKEMSSHAERRLSFADREDEDDPYRKNIQVADLNCLNASLAVLRWKKHCGFLADLEHEHYTNFTIETSTLISEERP